MFRGQFGLFAIVAMALGLQPYLSPGLLRDQESAVRTFVDQLDRFEIASDGMKRKARPSEKDRQALRSASDEVIRGAGPAEGAINTIINKLKDAGKWTTQLDTYAEEVLVGKGRIADREELRRQGGMRKTLEQLAKLTNTAVAARAEASLLGSLRTSVRITACAMYGRCV